MYFIPILRKLGGRRTLIDGSLESTCRVLVKCNWTSFSISYGWRSTSKTCQNSLLLGASFSSSLGAKISGGRGPPWEIFFGFYKTRHILLSNSANCTVLHAVVFTQYRRVTDGQTDGYAIASTAFALQRAVINYSFALSYCLCVHCILRLQCRPMIDCTLPVPI